MNPIHLQIVDNCESVLAADAAVVPAVPPALVLGVVVAVVAGNHRRNSIAAVFGNVANLAMIFADVAAVVEVRRIAAAVAVAGGDVAGVVAVDARNNVAIRGLAML